MDKVERTISKKHKVVFLVVALLVTASAVFYAYALKVTSPPLGPNEEISGDNAESAVVTENVVVKPAIASELHSSTIQTVVSHVNEEADTTQAQEIQGTSGEERHSTHIQKYLEQMRAVHTLTTQFIRKKDYENALKAIEQTSLPQMVKRILGDIESYKEQYMQKEQIVTQLFPQQGVIDRVVGHFVQITKLPSNNLTETVEHDRILKDMQVLTDYFYSEQFFKQVLHD